MPAKTVIPVTAIVSMGNPSSFQSLLIFYRNHAANNWDSVTMATQDNVTYTANIPAQDTGVLMDYYFCVHDALQVANAYFPAGYNPVIPSYQSTIPYQFAVGVTAADSTRFETAPANWHIGSNSGDNATTGKWQRVVPVQYMNYNAWPAKDHSGIAAGRCLLTGNGSGRFSHACWQWRYICTVARF